MLKENNLPLAKAIQDAWLSGSGKECDELVEAIASYVNCNPYKLYLALTNLHCLVSSDADINGVCEK